MTFRVNRELLKKSLRTELERLKKDNAKAAAKHTETAGAYPAKLLKAIDALRTRVAKGDIPRTRYGDIDTSFPKPPAKFTPDCQIADIEECLRILSLSNDETFSLNDQSRFYRYSCKLAKG